MTILFLPIGSWELAGILLLALLIFGAGRIPELARNLGAGIREMRASLAGESDRGATQKSRKRGK